MITSYTHARAFQGCQNEGCHDILLFDKMDQRFSINLLAWYEMLSIHNLWYIGFQWLINQAQLIRYVCFVGDIWCKVLYISISLAENGFFYSFWSRRHVSTLSYLVMHTKQGNLFHWSFWPVPKLVN